MAASEFAELELNFTQPLKGSYFLAMRFTPAASDVTQDSPAFPILLDFSTLRNARGLPVYGSLLARQVFSGADHPLRSYFQRFRDQAANVPLRLRLNIGQEAAALHEIDWEALQDPASGALLSTGERVWFSRFLISQDPRAAPLLPREQLRAVAAVAGPPATGLAPIDVPGEIDRARSAMGSAFQLICLPGEEQRATLDNIISLMRPRADILYLVCHGRLVQGKSILLLEDEDGKPQLVAGERLVEQIAGFLQPPRLVVLVSCDSLGSGGDKPSGALVALGPLLAAAGVPAVLAMHGQVSMSTISRFMPRFFEDLTRGGQIDRAVAFARGSVRDAPDAWMPVLFLRSRTGKLWQDADPQPPSQADLFGAGLARPPAGAPVPPAGEPLTTTLSAVDVQAAENFAHLVQFVDRAGEFKRFHQTLVTPLEQRAERIFAFSGETGMGKYWLLSRLQFECSFRRGMHCAYLDLEDINLQEPLDIMTGLAGQLSGAAVRRWLDLYQAWRFGGPQQAAADTPYAKNPIQAVAVLSEAFLKMLDELAQETAVVMLIDSLDTPEIQETTRRWVMDIILDKARAIRGFGVLPVVSLSQPPDFTDKRWAKLEIHTLEHPLERLGLEDITQYFRLRGLPEEIIQASLQECAEKTEGIPALVAAFARGLNQDPARQLLTGQLPHSHSENAQRQFFQENGLIARMVRAELDSQDELTRSAARACAIPHYFNQEILAALLGDRLSSGQAAQVLTEMSRWDFVRSLNPGPQSHGSPHPMQMSYRSEAREYLLVGVRKSQDFASLNERARAHFARQVNGSAPIDETAWLRLTPSQIHAMREMLYHLLQSDFAEGYELFRVLFRGAHQWYLPGEAATLLRFIRGLDHSGLPQRYLDELAYFEAVQSNADYDPAAAEARLNDLRGKTLEPELRARVLTELGKIYFATDRAAPAAQVFRESQEIWNQLRRPRESAALANNLGNVYLQLRDFRRARGFFQEAIDGLRRVGAPGELAQAHNNLGTAFEREEEWNSALKQFQTSLEMKNLIGDQFGAARTEVNIATVYHSQIRDVDDERRVNLLRQNALDRYQRSLEVFRQMGARSESATVLYKLSLLYYQSGQADLARQSLPEALEEFRALNIPGLENAEKLALRLGLPQ